MLATIAIAFGMGSIKTPVEAQQLTQPVDPTDAAYRPEYDYRQRLTVDSEIDSGSIVSHLKNKFINFAISQLDAENFLTELNSSIASMAGDIYTVLDDYGISIPKGRLGLPNVQDAKIIFDQGSGLNIISDILGGQSGSTYSNRDKLYQQYIRQVSEEYSNNSALSLSGQSKIEAKVDSAISSAEQSLIIAEDASSQDVSQNILRNIANQNALSQQTDAMIISDMQDAKVDRSLSLQMQSLALAELSGSNTRTQREATAANGAVISTSGLVTIPGMTSTNSTEIAE